MSVGIRLVSGETLKIQQHLNITVSHVIPSYENQTCTFDNINNYSTTKQLCSQFSFYKTTLLTLNGCHWGQGGNKNILVNNKGENIL